MPKTSYAIAIGSNRRHGRHGGPAHVVAAAIKAIGKRGLKVKALSGVHRTAAFGPAGREFANAAAVVRGKLDPPQMLALLKSIERDFGRRRGRRWGARVLDLDIILWSGGRWAARDLHIPHQALAGRGFVLAPLAEVAGDWRIPRSAATVCHLLTRFNRRQPIDRRPSST
jgi:2-amino-4-hydroxy-6-hydroxymethyldihydropteridine diphosphokinase